MKKESLEILVVKDNKEQIEGYSYRKKELENKYGAALNFTFAETFEDYQKVKNKDFDVVLTDLFIPHSSGKQNKKKTTEEWKEYLNKTSEKTERGVAKGELIFDIEDFDRAVGKLNEENFTNDFSDRMY